MKRNRYTLLRLKTKQLPGTSMLAPAFVARKHSRSILLKLCKLRLHTGLSEELCQVQSVCHHHKMAWVCSLEEESLGSGCVPKAISTIEKAVARYAREINGGKNKGTAAAPAMPTKRQRELPPGQPKDEHRNLALQRCVLNNLGLNFDHVCVCSVGTMQTKLTHGVSVCVWVWKTFAG